MPDTHSPCFDALGMVVTALRSYQKRADWSTANELKTKVVSEHDKTPSWARRRAA